MSTLKPLYGSTGTLTITASGLASDTNLLAGRQSTVVDNESSVLADDALLGLTVATTSTPGAGGQIEIWVFASWDGGTTYTAGAGAADAAFSPATLGVKNLMALAGVITQTDTTARTYNFGPVSIAQLFGGTMPDRWGVYIVQNTGQNLGATTVKYRPVQYQNV